MRSASKKKSLERWEIIQNNEGLEDRSGGPIPDYQGPSFLESLIDAHEDGISVHSLSGEILYANSRMLEILGMARSDVIGKRCDEVFHAGHCPHEEVISINRRVKLEGNSQDGKSVFAMTLSPLNNSKGEVIGFLRIVHDISETDRAQEELLRAEHFATLGQMVAGIAHDVGTPLNIISGYSEYLLMKAGPDGEGRKELRTIIQQTRRIADFIKQMLDLARPAQGRKDAIELKGFLADSLELLGSHLRKINVKPVLHCETASSVVYGDGPRLRQAIFNLMINAARDVGSGSEIHIVIDEPLEDRETAQVSVIGKKANGEGHDFSILFSGFASKEQRRGVTGMGLALASEILTEFGARIELSRMAEQGIALVLYLPKCGSDIPLAK